MRSHVVGPGPVFMRTAPGLNAGDHVLLGKSRNVAGIDRFDMFHPPPAVAWTIYLLDILISIEHRAHRAIADGVGHDLEAALVQFEKVFAELLRSVERCAAMTRLIDVGL